MEKQNLIIFASIAITGLMIVIWGFKFHMKTRRVIDTLGAVIFHVGAFGILYYKVQINIFISLVLLVLSLFILIDPLKISQLFNSSKIYHVFGYLSLLFSVVFSLEYFLHFPVWLWMIPLIIYILPYLIVPLRKNFRLISFLAWLIVFSYVCVIGFSIYKKYYVNGHLIEIKALEKKPDHF